MLFNLFIRTENILLVLIISYFFSFAVLDRNFYFNRQCCRVKWIRRRWKEFKIDYHVILNVIVYKM